MKNILISCISLLPGSPSAQPYTYKAEDITISATQTNEACIKFLVKKLGKKGETLDHYICVQSSKVEGSGENAEDSDTMKYLYKAVKEFCGELNLTPPAFFPCPLGKDESEHRFDRILSEISKKVLEIADSDEERKVTIHLDMAGGKRDNYVFIQLLTKLLSFYGFEVHTYYADIIDKEKHLGEIVNTDASFMHMKILDAVNEFVQTGSVGLLRRCYEGNQNRSVKKLLDAMDEFSASVGICSTDITDTYNKLGKLLTNVENNLTNDRDGLFMLKAMIPLIREKFGFEKDETNFVKDGSREKTALKIIKWCLDNNLIQQALTIYNEKAADIIINKHLVEIDHGIYDMCQSGDIHNPNAGALFYILDKVFDALDNSSRHSREAADELSKCNRNNNNLMLYNKT